jgi:hypothetical protein
MHSWWTELRTRGEIAGLRLFEPGPDDEAINEAPGFMQRFKEMFTLPPGEYDEEEYDDLSGATWSGGNTPMDGDDLEWEEDMAETLLILGIVFTIMALVWVRQLWTRWEMERVRRAADEQARHGGLQVDPEEQRRRDQMIRMAIGPPII